MHGDQLEAEREAEGENGRPAAGADRDTALLVLQDSLVGEIDRAIDGLERAHADETAHEHLETLRALLKAQVRTYLDHVAGRRATLASHTSIMYAGSVGADGVLSTTLSSLAHDGTVTIGQAAKLAQFVGERRSIVIIGAAGAGKSTLLNSLFEHVPVDERCVAIEQSPTFPALKERSFCVRLTSAPGADRRALFEKAGRMNPSRLIVSELEAEDIRELFSLLAGDPRIGGMATMCADTVTQALRTTVAAFGGDNTRARALMTQVRPVFVQLQRDDFSLARVTGIWSVELREDGGLVLQPAETGSPPGGGLVAEA